MIISSVATKHEDMTGLELMIVRVIADKIIEPFFYWRNENVLNGEPKGTEGSEISELSNKFDLDLSGYPERIGLRRIMVRDEWLQLLNALKMSGYRYESSTHSSVRSKETCYIE